MKLTMSGDKAPVCDSEPAQVVEIAQVVPAKKSSRLTKKHLLIAGVSLLVVGLIVACVLVAIHIVTNNEKEIFKFKTSYKNPDNKKETESVSVGENDNSVIYHVQQANVNLTVVDDFNRNVRVTKVHSTNGVVCYASILNRTKAVEPRYISNTVPSMYSNASSEDVYYESLPDPIVDKTFLGHRVQKMCNNIPTYWEQQSCTTAASSVSRQKRGCIVIRYRVIYRCYYYYYCYYYIYRWYCY